MSWIEVVAPEGSAGLLRAEYDAALQRAGRIWHIVSLMSQNPRSLRHSMRFYGVLMYGPSPLTRSQREMLACVVSRANLCRY